MNGGSPTQNAGRDNHANYYFGPVSNGVPASAAGGGDVGGGRRRRVLLGGGAATVVVALIGAAVTLLQTYLPGSGASSASATGASGSSAPAAPPAGGVRTSAAPTAGASTVPSSAAGPVQWQGTLLLGAIGIGDKDLDAPEPVHSQNSADNDVAVADDTDIGAGLLLQSYDSSALSVWAGAGRLPGYADCASTVDAGGSQQAPLRHGAVLCVRTPEGHLARLVVQAITTTMLGTEATFDTVVWTSPSGSPSAAG